MSIVILKQRETFDRMRPLLQKQLESFRLDANRLIHVAGYAEVVPFVKEDTEDLRSRRIGIILLFPDE